MKTTYLIIAITLLLSLSAALYAEDQVANPPLGKTAPDFALKDLKGKKWKLSDLKGKKVVLLEFGRIICLACIEAGKDLKTLDKKYSNKGLQILNVNLDGPMWRNAVNKYAETKKVKYPILLDLEKKTMRLYKIEYIPLLVLIDREGIVRFTYQGYRKEHLKMLSEKIEDLLPKKLDKENG